MMIANELHTHTHTQRYEHFKRSRSATPVAARENGRRDNKAPNVFLFLFFISDGTNSIYIILQQHRLC